MRKRWVVLLTLAVATMLGVSVMSVYQVLSIDSLAPAHYERPHDSYRLVLVSREQDTPFWAKLEEGARREAVRHGAALEFWGTLGADEEAFLKRIEIAIASKVDGIIVQGLDTDAFKQLTKVKAAGAGIPVVTVANDVPMNESLRRTYVGSDHLEAGRLLASHLIEDLGGRGKVVLMTSEREEHFERTRLEGIMDALEGRPDVDVVVTRLGETRERVVQDANAMLNAHPDANAFVLVSPAHAGAVLQEIGRRTRVEDGLVYAFDDSPDAAALLEQGAIDALLAQEPEAMGEESVEKLIMWLDGRQLPLDPEGYFTDIRVERAGE